MTTKIKSSVVDATVITQQTEDTAPDLAADMLLSYDASAAALKKVNLSKIAAVGKQTVWIPAGAMIPRTTNGAASGTAETTINKIMIKTLDFDPTTNEYAQFSIRMPKSWNESTVSAFFVWSNLAGSGNVIWGLQAVAISDDDTLDAAFGAAQEVTDTVTVAGDLLQTTETGGISIAGTPIQAGDLVVFQVYRNAASASDTMTTNDARLHGVVLIYTTDTINDA